MCYKVKENCMPGPTISAIENFPYLFIAARWCYQNRRSQCIAKFSYFLCVLCCLRWYSQQLTLRDKTQIVLKADYNLKSVHSSFIETIIWSDMKIYARIFCFSVTEFCIRDMYKDWIQNWYTLIKVQAHATLFNVVLVS